MPLDFDIGDGADALGQNQLTDALDGTYWVSGWDATLGTGDLEVDIAAGEGAINGGGVSTGAVQTVDFTSDPDATNPRKAVISVDDTGTVRKTIGNPAPAAPSGEVRFRTYDPQPPTNAPGVVVAEVWLDASETVLETADVRDRRVSNDAVEAVDAIPNVPNWVEDANSPANVNTDTYTYTLASNYDKVLIVGDPSNRGFNELQVNGETSGYTYLDNGDTQTAAANSFPILEENRRAEITLVGNSADGEIGMNQEPAYTGGEHTVYGSVGATPPISEFTLIGPATRDQTIRVYGFNV